jgi:hypothetical protein
MRPAQDNAFLVLSLVNPHLVITVDCLELFQIGAAPLLAGIIGSLHDQLA